MANPHFYRANVVWTGGQNGPAVNYEGYSRQFRVDFPTEKSTGEKSGSKPGFDGSADPSYRGDAALPNPEDLYVASISACHLLTYLALAVRSRMDVISYSDQAEGTMQMLDGRMRVTDVVLRPTITFGAGADLDKAQQLHDQAHDQCFISNSVSCQIRIEAEIRVAEPADL